MPAAKSYEHLTMPVTMRGWCDYQTRQTIAGMFSYMPGSGKLLQLLNKLTNIERSRNLTSELQKAAAQAEQKAADAQTFRAGFVCEHSVREMECGEHYRQELLIGDWGKQQTESGDLYATFIPLVADLIRSKQLQHVLNFGVSYAHIDSQLAQQFPQVQFTGVGRSPVTRYYNEQFFNLPNLRFESADMSEVLARQDWKQSVLLHTRTLSSMIPAFTERFYRAVAKAGCEHILLAEPCGISWETGKPYVFSDTPQRSVVLRNFMYIHNYPGLLQAAGYKIHHSTLLKTHHPDPNFRLVIIAASKS